MIKCKECGNEFEPKNKKGVFCSNKCRQKDYRKSVNKILKQVRNNGISEKALIEIAKNATKNKPQAEKFKKEKYITNIPKEETKESKPYMNEAIRKKLGL